MDTSQFLEAYVEEAKEHLQNMNEGLLKLEKKPTDKDVIYQIFRAAHTLKSMSGTMGFSKMADLAHSMEDLFDMIRNRKLKASPEIITLGFNCFDHLECSLKNVSAGKPELDTTELMDSLKLAQKKKHFKLKKVAAKAIDIEEIHSIKVPVKRLDNLLNLVGELISTETHLKNVSTKMKSPELDIPIARLDRLSEQIREEVMNARMIPLEQVFNKFPRMVRDLAKGMNKNVDLKIEGADVEMDRTVLDSIDTPLVHLLRNSVSHGIETTSERKTAKKRAAGTVRLSARKERESVTIAVSDDGGGIDLDRVRHKAIEKKIISAEEVKGMSQEALKMVLFHPDFSTAEKVTKTSGRGVGLNVVKNAVEALGGVIGLETEIGKGTTISMKIPASVAMVRLLLVGVGHETYGIPLSNVGRVVQVSLQDIKTFEGNETLIYRDESIPVLRLSDIFNIELEGNQPAEETIIIVETGIQRVGFIVGRIVGDQESIVKPIVGSTERAQYFSGASILPDGKVILVTDIPRIIKG